MSVLKCLAVLFVVLGIGMPAQAQPPEAQLKGLGVGMWIWQPWKCGSTDSMVRQAKERGIGHVYLKVHDGTAKANGVSRVPDIARAMKKAGIKVFAWGYNRANKPDQEADIAIAWLARDYVDGYVYNTERHMESKPKWGATELMVKKVWDYRASHCTEKWLGFCPFALPSLHGALAYPVLLQYTDFIEPQIYWDEMGGSVKYEFMRTYREWLKWEKENGARKPIIPLGQSYGGVARGERLEFGKRTRGYYAVAYWDWQHTNKGGWDEIGQVAEGRSGKWSDVASDEEPLPSNVSVPLIWVRWWRYWLAHYLQGSVLILSVWLLITVSRTSRAEERAVLGVILLIALAWPYVLALAVIGALVYTLYGAYRLIARQR